MVDCCKIAPMWPWMPRALCGDMATLGQCHQPQHLLSTVFCGRCCTGQRHLCDGANGANDEFDPAAAMTDDGRFLVAWTEQNGSGTKNVPMFTVFGSSGNVVSFDRSAPSQDLGINDQANADGPWRLTARSCWFGEETTSTNARTVSYRRFGANGNVIATEDSLASGTRLGGGSYTVTGKIFDPRIAMDRAGSFVIVVTNDDATPNTTNLLYYEFSSTGTELVSAQLAHTAIDQAPAPGLCGQSGGQFHDRLGRSLATALTRSLPDTSWETLA